MKNVNLNRAGAVVIFLVTTQALQAQVSVNAGGSGAPGDQVIASIGQVFYLHTDSANGKVEDGIQQPYEVEVLATEEAPLDESLKVYPNPAKDFLNINKGTVRGNLDYQLYDMQGKKIKEGSLRTGDLQINMQTYLPGVYILKIVNPESGKTKTFKILKR